VTYLTFGLGLVIFFNRIIASTTEVMVDKFTERPEEGVCAVSVDAYSSRPDALQGRFSALAQARPLGTPQAQCRSVSDADRRHRGDRPCRLFRDEPRLSGITQADGDILSRERRDEQDAG
jgi:hypothetical protein